MGKKLGRTKKEARKEKMNGKYEFGMDRYHGVMGEFFIGEFATVPNGSNLGNKEAVFYIAQRKVPYAPVLGHSTLAQTLIETQIDAPHARHLREDRADLTQLAERLQEEGGFLGKIRLVQEGTIIFSREPFGDISGPLWNIQLHEVKFEHAFDLPATVGYRAMRMRQAAGPNSFLSVFSLRRDGDPLRSIRVSKIAYICGFDDTSDMEAAFQLGIPDVGTMAHYLVESFIGYNSQPEIDEKTGQPKHFERVAFERWLDGNPKGTVLLIDTIDYRMGIVHAIQAALSSPERKRAFKGIRIDSGDLIEASQYCRRLLDANGLKDVGIVLTGDLDEKIERIRKALIFPIKGYGIGTKLAAEVDFVAGVIFKMSQIDGVPVLKCSGAPGKETLPGQFQIWRCVDGDGNYVKDIISLIDESEPEGEDFVSAIPLLEPFWGGGIPLYQNKSPEKLREFVKQQLKRFKGPLERYPVIISPKLLALKQEITESIKDQNVYGEVKMPDGAEKDKNFRR